MNDYFLEARSHAVDVARGFSETGGPDDLQGIVLMGDRAVTADGAELEQTEWVYEYGTNLAEALDLAAKLINGQAGRLVVVSDLFATAHTDAENQVVFSWPPGDDTIEATIGAIQSCRQASITIEAWRFHHPGTPEPDKSTPIREAILAAGGTIHDIPIADDRPDLKPGHRNAG